MPLTQIKDDVIQNLNANKVTGAFTTSADGSQLTGLSAVDWDLRYNLAINYFNDSVRENFDRSGLDQGWIDVFKDTDDVDGEGVSVPMTKFDGVNDYLNIPDGTLGWSDSAKVTWSFWLKVDAAGEGTNRQIFSNQDSNFRVRLETNNKMTIWYQHDLGSPGQIWGGETTRTFTASDGLVHVVHSMDATAGTVHTYVNGSEETMVANGGLPFPTPNNGTVNFANGGNGFNIGAYVNDGTQDWYGTLGQVYLNTQEYIDLSVQANRELFYKDGNPVDLGSDGSKPTGSSPYIYLNNPYGSFQTNLGSGGGPFSVTGELVDGGYITDKIYDSGADSFSNSYELIDNYGKENSISNGFTMGDHKIAGQCMTLSTTQIISRIGFYLGRDGSPSGPINAEIHGVTGTPNSSATSDGNILAVTASKEAGSINTSRTMYYFDFSEPVKLAAGNYFIGLNAFSMSGGGANIIHLSQNTNNTDSGGNASKSDANGNWTGYASNDIIYYLYGQKNLDLITKGSDDIGNSPSTAPTKGHMELLVKGHRPITAKDYSPDTEDHGYTNTSLRVRYTATSNATRIRLKLKGSITRSNTNIRNISIGEEASNFNCKTTPTEIFTGGSSGMFVYTGKYGITDWFDFDISKGTSYLITFDLEADASNDDVSMNNSTGDGAVAQNVNGSNSGVTYNVATFGTRDATENTGKVWCLDSVETLDIATLDTDIIGQISRNGGGSDASNWTDIPLKRIKTQVGGSPNNLLVGNATLTSTTGTNIVGRIKTANKDKITVQGISVNWS